MSRVLMTLRSGWASSAGLTAAYLARALAQWFLLWLFASAAGSNGAGAFSYALAVSAPVFVFLQLGMRNLYMSMQQRPSFRIFFRVRIVLATVAVITLAIFAIFYDGVTVQILAPVVAIKFFDSLTDICTGYYHSANRTSRVVASMFANATGTVVAAVAVYAISRDPVASLWASAVVSALVFMAFGGPVVARARRESELVANGTASAVKRIAKSGLPMSLAESVGSVLSYLPIFYLSMVATSAEVGVFAAAMYIVTFANLFYASTQQVWLPRLAKAREAGLLRQAAVGPLAAMWALGLAGATAVFTLWPMLLPAIYGPEFTLAEAEALPLALAVFLLAIFYSVDLLLMVLNRYHSQLFVSIVALLTTLIVALALPSNEAVRSAGILVAISGFSRALWGVLALRSGKASNRRR